MHSIYIASIKMADNITGMIIKCSAVIATLVYTLTFNHLAQ